jgi:hypothetical protein
VIASTLSSAAAAVLPAMDAAATARRSIGRVQLVLADPAVQLYPEGDRTDPVLSRGRQCTAADVWSDL